MNVHFFGWPAVWAAARRGRPRACMAADCCHYRSAGPASRAMGRDGDLLIVVGSAGLALIAAGLFTFFMFHMWGGLGLAVALIGLAITALGLRSRIKYQVYGALAQAAEDPRAYDDY
jgi:hypothetical protein